MKEWQSSCSQIFFKISALKNFAILTGTPVLDSNTILRGDTNIGAFW